MKRMMKCVAGLFMFGVVIILGANQYVVSSQEKHIVGVKDARDEKSVDCILVLGCYVHKDGTMSRMLKDRMDKAVELYKNGVAPKLLVSGDHGKTSYDEVNTMKEYAISKGVASEDIFMDHAGFATYESVYRAKEVFQVKKCIIVTQKYHLYRSLYTAKKLGMKAYGVAAKEIDYSGQTYRSLREVLARDKDFLFCITKPKPEYLGETISISGDGNITNDKKK